MKQPMMALYEATTFIFDPLQHFWEDDRTQRTVAGILVFVFLFSIAIIEMKRQGWIVGGLADRIPTSHFMAISIAFTLVLTLEVIGLIFTLPCSISRAVGKQFEILALILLRSAFKTLADFPEPITLTGNEMDLWIILCDGAGAVVIFTLLGVYKLLQTRLDDTIKRGPILFRFVAAKKLVALVILGIFVSMIGHNISDVLAGKDPYHLHFFQNFYTVLIFSDIMLVLIAQRFLPEFKAIFRNSGYALATLLIRLALAAPPFYNAAIGVAAAVFACLLTLTYTYFYSSESRFAKKLK